MVFFFERTSEIRHRHHFILLFTLLLSSFNSFFKPNIDITSTRIICSICTLSLWCVVDSSISFLIDYYVLIGLSSPDHASVEGRTKGCSLYFKTQITNNNSVSVYWVVHIFDVLWHVLFLVGESAIVSACFPIVKYTFTCSSHLEEHVEYFDLIMPHCIHISKYHIIFRNSIEL